MHASLLQPQVVRRDAAHIRGEVLDDDAEGAVEGRRRHGAGGAASGAGESGGGGLGEGVEDEEVGAGEGFGLTGRA